MAVYTPVSAEQLEHFLAQFSVGALRSFKGIAEGVENSNFLVETRDARFILTLYEKRVRREDLPFFLGLMRHLADRGLPCPCPIPAHDGAILHDLNGKPACLIEFLEGVSLTDAQDTHAFAVGEALARLHMAALDLPLTRANDLSLTGWARLSDAIGVNADTISPGLGESIHSALSLLQAQWPSGLPQGAIHADLFPDNVLFLDGAVSGIIDFYFAATDFLAYDIAVCLNAWSFAADGSVHYPEITHAMMQGYESVRPLTTTERDALGILCQGAALRFLLTRAYDWINTPADALVTRKDPIAFLRRLQFYQNA